MAFDPRRLDRDRIVRTLTFWLRPEFVLRLVNRFQKVVGFDRSDDLIRGLAASGLTLTRHAFRFRTDNQIVFWEAVRAGNGIGIGQEPLARRDPLLEIILPELELPALPVWLAMHRDVRTSVRIRRVADFLHEELKRYSAG